MSISDIFIEQLAKDDISLIEPFWVELNALHGIQSTHFKDHFRDITFSKRCESLLVVEDLGIFIAKTGAEVIGYCIASYQNKIGEIDSLFIKEKYRNNDLGKGLMTKSLQWLSNHNCSDVKVTVAEGNEHILAFYEQYGFKKRSYVLQR